MRCTNGTFFLSIIDLKLKQNVLKNYDPVGVEKPERVAMLCNEHVVIRIPNLNPHNKHTHLTSIQ